MREQIGKLLLMVSVLTIGLMMGAITPLSAQTLGTEWTADFYNNTDLSGTPTADNVQYPNGINFNWGDEGPRDSAGLPITSIGADNFSARFTSNQEFASAGDYLFTFRFNDGMRVYLDGALIVDQFTDYAVEDPNAFAQVQEPITLTAGVHTLIVEYVEFTGVAIAQVQWGYIRDNDELITNGSFETPSGTPLLRPWKGAGLTGDKVRCNTATKIVAEIGQCAFQFKGSQAGKSSITQKTTSIPTSLQPTDVLTLSAYIDTKVAAPVITVKVKYTDDSAGANNNGQDKIKLSVEAATDGYQLFTESLTLDGTVQKITTQISFKRKTGKLTIDGVSLKRDGGSSTRAISDLMPLPAP